MDDPQIWTLIGVFAASTFGLVGLISTWWTRMIRAEFAAVGYRFDAVETGLGARIDSAESTLGARIDSVEARLEARIDGVEARLDAKIDKLDTRIDHLDRDITGIVKRVFPDES